MEPIGARRVSRGATELWEALAEQSSFLFTSARLFDEGQRSEAKRLATTLRVLAHTDKSLLHLLGVRDRLRFASVVRPDENRPTLITVSAETTVVESRPAMVVEWAPILHVAEYLPFAEWWQAPVMAAGSETFSRWELIKGPANQNGGAHVDPRLDARYAALSRGEIGGVIAMSDIPVYSEVDPVLACVRAIAHEVMVTFEEQMLEYAPPPPRRFPMV